MSEMSLDEINKIMRTTKPRMENKTNDPFIDHKAAIEAALEAGHDTVVLGLREFRLTIFEGLFRIEPIHGFVPMGYFPWSWLRDV